MSIYDLMSIGNNAMMNAKLGISVTGNNINNADVEGFSRNTVNYASRQPITRNGLQVGTGADAVNINRHYNYFVEQQYLSSKGQEQFWHAKAQTLYSVESLFKQDKKDYGLSAALDKYFTSWNALTQNAGNSSYRMELVEYSNTLTSMLHTMDATLRQEYAATNKAIEVEVANANTLIKDVAELNRGVMEQPDNLVLKDERDRKIRKLGELLPIKTVQQEDGSFTVITQNGQTLVDGTETFELLIKAPEATKELANGSTFDGQVYFDGNGAKEFKIEMVSAGVVGSGTPPTFKVSVDGGKSWLTDKNGKELTYTAGNASNKVTIEGVDIWFGTAADSQATPANAAVVGDSFNVVPKENVYWKKTTAHLVNITPLGGYGSESVRLGGGKIAGLLAARDSSIETYHEVMDAYVNELIWQTNYQHSQGAGLSHYTSTKANNSVTSNTTELGKSNLAFADRITDGSISFWTYNEQGNPIEKQQVNVGPASSLEDVRAAIDGLNNMSARIENGQLVIEADGTNKFEFAGDTSGVLAALGLNTFFQGSGIKDIDIDARIKADPNRIAGAVVDGLGLVKNSDNTNATAIYNLMTKNVTLDTIHTDRTTTFSGHLSALTAKVGADMDGASRNQVYNGTVAKDLNTRQQSVSGVNMDEELTNLTKYQNSFDVASKLIKTANEMFDTVLSLKS